MNDVQLATVAQTVVQLDSYFDDLKAQALAIYHPDDVALRGYITPSQELQLRHLQLSYWKARNALLELVNDIRLNVERLDQATSGQFLVAFAAAALLVDAARFLRENFHLAKIRCTVHHENLKKKWGIVRPPLSSSRSNCSPVSLRLQVLRTK